jgi:clan AA aspartic protease
MGITYIDGDVQGPGKKTVHVRFLVYSGAAYTLLPEKVWKELKLKPMRKMNFSLADGTQIARQISECRIKLPQGEGHTTVILGESGDQPLLGVYTLEGFGLVLNPFSRELQPMRAMLASHRLALSGTLQPTASTRLPDQRSAACPAAAL